jgi:DHA1 family inner membrane transport protein
LEQNESWKTIISSSALMSLALLGDALIYAILPLYAEDFGLTIPMVGILLAANRIVRIFIYTLISKLVTFFGARTLCVIAAIMATVSTCLYGIGSGFFPLLCARILWGIAYAILLLSTLAYAVSKKGEAGTRIGTSQAIQRIGPIISLLLGTWLVSILSPNHVFLVLTLPTSISIFIALTLPKREKAQRTSKSSSVHLTKPSVLDLLFFIQGYAIDGLFAVSITLMLAENTSLAHAAIGGGVLLALRHVGEAMAAPLFGSLGDRFGAVKIFTMSAALTVVGLLLIAFNQVISGAIILLIFRGAIASLGPTIIAQQFDDTETVLDNLARLQSWRDIGAAAGPMVTGFALVYISAEMQHLVLAIIFGVVLALSSPKIATNNN